MSILAGLAGAVAVLVAALVKGAIGFGFPLIATPLLALTVDLRTAVAVLLVPNIAMDVVQVARRGAIAATLRRLWLLLAAGAVGMSLGTRLLVTLDPRVSTRVLGACLVLFVAINGRRVPLRVPAGWEPWVSPVVGVVAGLLGGVTNVPGTPLVLYYYALGMEKYEFVRSVSLTFVIYKLVQLGAAIQFGLLSWRLLGISVGLTVLGCGAFALGLRVQDRLHQGAFDRMVLAAVGLLGTWLLLGSFL